MKTLLSTLLLLLSVHCIAQTDRHGNPVFNSITTKEEQVKNYTLVSNYYTLKNNVENKLSSVYISDNPTLDDILKAATSLPSEFFIIIQGETISNMVMILNRPSRQFLVINPSNGDEHLFVCSVEGDISENRANEIIKENYDPSAKISGSKLYFNNKKLKIISNKVIETNVLQLIEEQKLNSEDTSNVKLLSQEEIRKIVLAESEVGGKLDFFTEIKGHEMDGIQIKPGVFDTKIGMALYQWGRANFDLGTNTIDDALLFWAELKGRQANEREKFYINLGFNKELEK